MLYTSRFPSSPDPKDTKMLSVLNKRFLFAAVRVIERLHWFSVVNYCEFRAYIWVASLNKRNRWLSTTTQHNPPVSLLSGRNGADEKQACHHPLVKKLFRVPAFSGLVARESTYVTHLSLPACHLNT